MMLTAEFFARPTLEVAPDLLEAYLDSEDLADHQ